MNLKTWIPLVLAIVLGLVAAKVARDSLSKDKRPAPAGNFVQIVVTKKSIAPGQQLTAEDLAIGQVSPESVPEGAFDSIAKALDRTAKVEMVKNQAIVEPLLAEAGKGSGLQALVPEGMRAITIEVNEFSGIAGMVAPGFFVDVVTTIQSSGGDEMLARTIVQNVKVTAVGQRVSAKVDPKDDQQQQQQFRSVTLLTTPEEAEAIELANTTGRPWLVLRGGQDDERVATLGVSISKLRGKDIQGNSNNDPFGSASDNAPTTKPSPLVDRTERTDRQPERIVMNTRTVQIIRGGAETNVTVTMPTIQGADYTGTNDITNEDQ